MAERLGAYSYYGPSPEIQYIRLGHEINSISEALSDSSVICKCFRLRVTPAVSSPCFRLGFGNDSKNISVDVLTSASLVPL